MFRNPNKRFRRQEGEEVQTTGKLLFELEKSIRDQQGQLRQTKTSKSTNQALLAARAGEAYVELIREKQAAWRELCAKKEEETETAINKLEEDWRTEVEVRSTQQAAATAPVARNQDPLLDQARMEQWMEQRLETQRAELERAFEERLATSRTNNQITPARLRQPTQQQQQFYSYVNSQHNLSEEFEEKINIGLQQQAISQLAHCEETVMDTVVEE